jgi:dihydroorotase
LLNSTADQSVNDKESAMTKSQITHIDSERELDLALIGGRVIDPATGLDAIKDVGIKGDKIVEISDSVRRTRAKVVRDVSGRLVVPGLIDTHAHCYTHVTGPFGLNPEDVGVRAGVATVVDQGGASPLTMGGFQKFVAEPATTRVLSFVSTYLAGGLYGHQYVDLYGPTGVNVDAILKSIDTYPDLIRGIKAHAEPGSYSRWGLDVLRMAKQAGRTAKLPVYIHLGTLWPEKDGKQVDTQQLLSELIPLLDEGDILAHPFSRYPSGFVGPDNKVHPLVFEAQKRGVKIDVGRGSHFSFDVAAKVFDSGVMPDTLGADLHGYNISKLHYDGQFRTDVDYKTTADAIKSEPTFSLHHAMTELLALGMAMPDLMKTVTSAPAAMLGLSDILGSLQPGRVADVSVMELESGDFVLKDGGGSTHKATQRFKPYFMLRAGKIHEADSELLPVWERRAA